MSFRCFLPFSPWRAPSSKPYVSKTKKHSKIHRWQVLCSFAGATNVLGQKSPVTNTCRIVKEIDAIWAHLGPSKPCLPLSIDGINIKIVVSDKTEPFKKPHFSLFDPVFAYPLCPVYHKPCKNTPNEP